MHCSRCGRETDVRSGPDGGFYCEVCIIHAEKPECRACEKCFRRVCGVYACSFCPFSSGNPDAALLKEQLRLQPITVEEKCERCGGGLDGHAFVLHGKALCKPCLLYEQDRWEIVPGSPGKGGVRVKTILPKSAVAEEMTKEQTRIVKKLFHSLGINLANPPPDPLKESPMPDDACISCEDEKAGKRRRKLVGGFPVLSGKSSSQSKAPRFARFKRY
jgi:hypothetical protein